MKILFLFSLLCVFRSYSQPNYEWSENLTSFSHIYTIHALDNKNIIVYGIKTDAGLSIAELDSLRNIIWSKQVPGMVNQSGNFMAVDNEGNIFITGSFFGTITIDGVQLASSIWGESAAAYLCKYNYSGNLQWAKAITGSTGSIQGRGIDCDAFGNVIVGGDFQSAEVLFDNISVQRSTNENYSNDYLAKYDSSGNIVWARNVGTIKMSVCNFHLTIDQNNDVYVTTGMRNDTLIFANDTLINPYPEYANSMLLAKFSSQGDRIWARVAEPMNNNSSAYGICVISDIENNVYVGGTLYGQISISPSYSFGQSDIFTAKYDNSGNLQWAKTLGSYSTDEFFSIGVDRNQNVFISGFFDSPYINFEGHSYGNANWNSSNIFLARYNSSGNPEWIDVTGGEYTDQPRSLSVDGQNNIYTSGYFQSGSITFGDHMISNITPGSCNAYIAKISGESTMLNVENINTPQFSVFPNPFNESVTINSSESLFGSEIRISDLTGIIVNDISSISATETTIRLDNLPSGMYFVTIIKNGIPIYKEKIISLN